MKNEAPSGLVSAELFAANAERIRAQIAAIGFRQLLGAELDELGVSAFLVVHGATIAVVEATKLSAATG